MRVLLITCITALLTVAFIGCGQSASGERSSALDQIVTVELTHVDPEVRAFLARKQQAVRDAPHSSAAIGELAMSYEMNGFLDSALLAYRLAMSTAPTSFRWPYFESLVLASFGDYERALTTIDRAMVIDATYVPAWIWKGRWLLELNELSGAEDAFTRALDLEVHSAAIVGLAHVALRRDEVEPALELLDELVQRDSHPEVVRLIAIARSKLGTSDSGNTSQSKEMLGQIGFPDPLSAEKRAYEVSISAALSRFRDLLSRPDSQGSAFELVDLLYEKYPDNRRVVIAKAHRLRLSGDVAPLRGLLEEAHSTWPEEINFKLGLAELETNLQKSEDALRLIEEALAIDPYNAWGLLQQGIALAQQGRFEEVVNSLLQALAVDASAEVHFYLGHAYAELSEFSAAHCHMKRAVELSPDFTEAKEHLERLYAITNIESFNDAAIENCARNVD